MKNRHQKYILILFGICLFLAQVKQSSAQYLEKEPTPVQRIFWGGNIGLMFGNYTYIAVDPVVGYRLTNRLSAGIGGNYSWTKSTYYDYVGQTYGCNVFASFTLIKNLSEVLPFYDNGGILLYGELSLINTSDLYNILPYGREVWAYTPMAGFAYQSPIGPRSYMLVMILYNFNESSVSPYPNPVFRISFQF